MNHKILIVDDNEKNISQMELLLEYAGYSVVSASNGTKVVEATHLEHHDLILMDIQMPDMYGFSVAREIFADEHTSAIPTIGISSYASPLSREKALRMGMVGFSKDLSAANCLSNSCVRSCLPPGKRRRSCHIISGGTA
jgi:CheY-like chemotaxis protein